MRRASSVRIIMITTAARRWEPGRFTAMASSGLRFRGRPGPNCRASSGITRPTIGPIPTCARTGKAFEPTFKRMWTTAGFCKPLCTNTTSTTRPASSTRPASAHLQWILQNAPEEYRTCWVQTGSSPAVSQSRIAAVQTAAAEMIGADQVPQVALCADSPFGLPAQHIDSQYRKFVTTLPEPRILYESPRSRASN